MNMNPAQINVLSSLHQQNLEGTFKIFFFYWDSEWSPATDVKKKDKNTTLVDKLQAIQYSSGYKSKASQDSKYIVKGLQIMHDTGS